MMKKKRPFILLELLVGLSILALFITPLIRQPLHFLQQELTEQQRIEIQRDAANCSALIKTELYQNKIPTEILFSTKETDWREEKIVISLSDKKSSSFIRKISFKEKRSKEQTEKKSPYHLVDLQISYHGLNHQKKRDRPTYHYFFYVQES